MRHVVRTLVIALALVVELTTPVVAPAQTPIGATANVIIPVSVGGVVNMEFGSIIQGTAKTITYNDDGPGHQAAEFTVTGTPPSSASVEFTLPANLTGPAASTLPLSAWALRYGINPDASGGGTRTLGNGHVVTISFVASPVWYFRVGATATAVAGQTAGDYTGAITVTATYP